MPHSVVAVDTSSHAISIDWKKCIGCNSCARVCARTTGMNVYRENKTPRQPPLVRQRDPIPKSRGSIVDIDLDHANSDTDRVRISVSDCIGCGQCALVCPVSCITPCELDLEATLHALEHKRDDVLYVALVSPSARVGISELAGLPAGTTSLRQLGQALRTAGFDYVFDVNWGADLTTLVESEDVYQAKRRGSPRPVFTSCCPAWINMAENLYPSLLHNISESKSCVAMLASMIHTHLDELIPPKKVGSGDKTSEPAHYKDVYIVDIMPCTAKKQEARRVQLRHTSKVEEDDDGEEDKSKAPLPHAGLSAAQDVDACLTIPETYKLLQTRAAECVPFKNEPDDTFPELDRPLSDISTGSEIFGRKCGVAENVLRQISLRTTGNSMTMYETLSKELIWETDAHDCTIYQLVCTLAGTEYRALVATGGKAVQKVCELAIDGKLSNIDVVEQMVCPGGCIGGGGMPKVRRSETGTIQKSRTSGLDALDTQVESHFGRVVGGNNSLETLLHKTIASPEEFADIVLTTFKDWDESTCTPKVISKEIPKAGHQPEPAAESTETKQGDDGDKSLRFVGETPAPGNTGIPTNYVGESPATPLEPTPQTLTPSVQEAETQAKKE